MGDASVAVPKITSASNGVIIVTIRTLSTYACECCPTEMGNLNLRSGYIRAQIVTDLQVLAEKGNAGKKTCSYFCHKLYF